MSSNVTSGRLLEGKNKTVIRIHAAGTLLNRTRPASRLLHRIQGAEWRLVSAPGEGHGGKGRLRGAPAERECRLVTGRGGPLAPFAKLGRAPLDEQTIPRTDSSLRTSCPHHHAACSATAFTAFTTLFPCCIVLCLLLDLAARSRLNSSSSLIYPSKNFSLSTTIPPTPLPT